MTAAPGQVAIKMLRRTVIRGIGTVAEGSVHICDKAAAHTLIAQKQAIPAEMMTRSEQLEVAQLHARSLQTLADEAKAAADDMAAQMAPPKPSRSKASR